MYVVQENPPGVFIELVAGSTIIDSEEVQHPWQIIGLWTDAELAVIGVYRVPLFDIPADRELASYSFARQGGSIVAVPVFAEKPIPPPPPPPTTDQLIAYAADARYRREISGVDWTGSGTHRVATDRDSQTKILAEFVAINSGLRVDGSPWKFAGGEFIPLANAQMIQVVQIARAYIADAFAREEQAREGILTGTIGTRAQVDAIIFQA